MKKFLAWLKAVFSRDVAPQIVAAAEQAAIDLEKYQKEFADAQRLVLEAEKKYEAEPKSGSKKWAMVTGLLATGWTKLKPHVISFLAALAVSMLKKELAERAAEPPPSP